MSPLEVSIVHINASLPLEIDESTFIACIRGTCTDQKWRPHILTFFLETPAGLIHDIVLSGAVTFKELMDALSRWKAEEYADEDTTRWIQEMAYLSMGRAAELGITRFV
ncbi:MAG: hypothetical protein U5R49_01205 [Deltaproteobacteria bacterium]|nr:hypothetical protein [Deltaproteobacteria bacterium]